MHNLQKTLKNWGAVRIKCAISVFLSAFAASAADFRARDFGAAGDGAAKDFDPRDYGAKGDGTTMDTAALQRTIDACAQNGGGRVVLASGRFLTGTLILKSGVELHLNVTGTLLGSPNCADYPERTDVKHVTSENLPRNRNACLIYAEEAHDIALSGRGTIDCSGAAFVRRRQPDEPGWAPFIRIPGYLTPPRVVFFAGCRDVLVTDVKVVNQPSGWGYWIHDCDGVIFDRVRIDSDLRFPNNDGIHVNCSRDVSISNCRISCCDDAIVVRANSRSLAENRACERVTVANCSLRSYCACIRIGYLNDGIIRNCTFSNLAMYGSRAGIRLQLPKYREEKSDRGREATLVENMCFSNISMEDVERAFDVNIDPGEKTLCAGVRDLHFVNVHVKGGKSPQFLGRKENPLERFTFTACTFDTDEPATFQFCKDFRFDEHTFPRTAADAPGDVKRLILGAADIGFRVDVADGNGALQSIGPADMASFRSERADRRIRLVWKGHPKLGDGFTVSATLEETADGFAYSDVRYEGASGPAVLRLAFPEIVLPRTDSTRLLIPHSVGLLRSPNWRNLNPGDIVGDDAPQGFHFVAALEDSGDSYYLDQRGESRLHASRYEIANGKAPGTLRVCMPYDVPQTPANARAFALPYGGTFHAFRGGWYRAASIYREWLERQPHYRTARAHRGRLRDVGLWMWSRGRSASIMPDVERLARDAAVPMGLDWYWWHKTPYDTGYPYFWPPREGVEDFRAAVARFRKLGVWTQTYVNGTAWDCDDPSWADKGGAKNAIIRDGKPLAHEYNKFNHHRLAPMCGEAPEFHDIMAHNVRELLASGLDSIYLDQIANIGFGTCFNPLHRHAPGGGDHLVRGYRDFVVRLRKEHPNAQFSSEDYHESYIDVFDSVICVYSGYERFGRGLPEVEFVPVCPALYHECITAYGSFAMIDGIPPWDENWPASARWPADKELAWEKIYPDQFAIEVCRGVTWGMQPMVHNFKAARADDPRYAADYRFLIDTARFYHANRDFLLEGRLLDPGTMECPEKPVDFLVRKTFTPCGNQKTVHVPSLPQVFYSVWRAPDGRMAAVLVNWSREDAEVKLSAPDVSFAGRVPARSWMLVPKTAACLEKRK